MKIVKYTLLGAMIISSLASCNKWLDLDPKSSLSTNNFYTTASEAEQALMGVYNGLLPLAEYSWFMSELRSDNVWANNADESAAQRDYIDIFTYSPNLTVISTLNDAWLDHYEIIARANLLLEKIEKTTFKENSKLDIRTLFKAEARFLRAYAYFELVRYFGRVPVALKPLSVNEAMSTPQSEPKDIYERVIIPDLQYAIDNLEETAYNYKGVIAPSGRANMIVAKALLGRVYLTMAGFPLNDTSRAELAKQELEWVIDYADQNGKYWAKTGLDWQKIWVSDNDNKYHIFEIQYIAKQGYGNPMVYWTAPRVGSDYIDLQMSGYNLPGTTDLVSLFNTVTGGSGAYDDVRRSGTFDFQFSTANTFFVKFFEHKKKRSALGYGDNSAQVVDRTYFPLNFPVLRLEDVMLMYAEIVGPTTKGIEMVNRIRTRAGLGALSPSELSDFATMVEIERRRELAGEGIRWHDLVRSNTYKDALRAKFHQYGSDEGGNITRPGVYAMANRVIDGTYLYPIPDTQMKANDGLYQQNLAYR